jgi:coniferyl-aldehyde dehydrogenase
MATILKSKLSENHDERTMRATLEFQRAAALAAQPEPISVRKDRMTRAIAMLVDNAADFCTALNEDFGGRSHQQSMLTDIMPAVNALKHARKHVDSWARDERRKPLFPLSLIGGKAKVMFQPKGVVGIIAPWNYPVGMVMVPMACILAAGNRVMAKPSEFTPQVTALFETLVPRYFAADEVAIVSGGADVGQAFSALPFDHIIFTGATSVGRHIMRAAADNLTPVTLELGGKSPVVIGQSADMAKAADRIILGKMMNAGQTCLAPDYLLVPKSQEADMIGALKVAAASQYPTIATNPDYTAVVNDRHFARLSGYIDDAKAKGAEVIVVNPANEDFSAANNRKMPLHILRNVTDEMAVMQDEIFGPLLPVMTTEHTNSAIDYINAHDRPLGLYYFGKDSAEENLVINRTTSGGVTVNDVVMHVAMDDLPFGGIGPSGMGHYHGFDGFKTFSHARAVYRQSPLDVGKIAGIKAPYGPVADKNIARAVKK